MNKYIFSLCFFTLSFLYIHAQSMIEIPLGGRALKSNGITIAEKEFVKGKFLNISKGTLYVYPAINKNSEIAMILCPGGGYTFESLGRLHEMAQWLASEGITGIVYKYRLPNAHSSILLADAAEVFDIIHSNAMRWKIDTLKIGICGFSAGGHLASLISTAYHSLAFSILFYPVISMDKNIAHTESKNNLLGKNPSTKQLLQYSTDKHVSKATPPTLIFLADDDKEVNPLNSIYMYQALKKNNIPSAMYILPTGGHPFYITDSSFGYAQEVQQLLLSWLKHTLPVSTSLSMNHSSY